MIWKIILLLLLPFITLEAVMLMPPDRKNDWHKLIYMGLPGWFMVDQEDGMPVVAGVASLAMRIHFNGYFAAYKGSYVVALFFWVFYRD